MPVQRTHVHVHESLKMASTVYTCTTVQHPSTHVCIWTKQRAELQGHLANFANCRSDYIHVQHACHQHVHVNLQNVHISACSSMSHLRLTSSNSSSSSSIFSSMSLLILLSDVSSDSAVLLVCERTSDSRSSFSWRICLFSSSSCCKWVWASKLRWHWIAKFLETALNSIHVHVRGCGTHRGTVYK